MDVVTVLRELKSAVDAQIEAWKVAQGIIVSSYDSLITSIKGFISGYCDAKIIELKSKSGAEPPEEFIGIINNSLKSTKEIINEKDSVIGNYTYSGSNIMYFHHGIGNKVCEGAFNNCSMLFAVYMPDLVACTNAKKLFNGCSSLTSLTFPEGSLSAVTTIERLLTGCSSLTSVTFPEGSLYKVSNMHDAFNGCSKVTSITFPNGSLSGVKNVRSAFSFCKSLTSITFPDGSLLSVDNAETMFYNCSSLTSLTFPDGSLSAVTNASQMFYNCVKLTSLTFPDGSLSAVTNAYSVFSQCSKLTEINGTINLANATEISYFAYKSAIPETKLAEMRDTINWSIVKNASGHFYGDKFVKTFSHPETISLTTAKEMFRASKMETIDIDLSNLTEVASYIFDSSKSLTSVTLHGGIGDVASVEHLFADCTALTTITGLSFKSVTCTSLNMFLNCTALTDCKYEGTLYMSGISLSPCTNLSAESLYSWVSALYDWKTNSEGKTTTSTSHVLTLSESQIESLRSYTGDNGESGESAYVLALEKGWDITL